MEKQGVITTIIRKVLNTSLQEATPGQLVDAIRTNASLMGSASEHIDHYAGFIPPIAMGMAERQLTRVNATHKGGLNGLVMDWLAADQPVYHSLLLNTEGGKEWLEAQVTEILEGFGIRL